MNSIISFCKKIVFFSVLIIFGLSVFSNPVYSQTQNWTYVTADSDFSSDVYVDKNKKKLSNGNIRAWQKYAFNNGYTNIALSEWDCEGKRSRIIQETVYDNFNQVLKTFQRPQDWLYVIPESVGVGLYRVVCNNSNKDRNTDRPKTKTKISLAEITTTAASLRESPNINGSLIREVSFGEQLILANEEPSGNWHKVIDKETQSEGWLHNTTFKIIKPSKSSAKKVLSKKKP